MNNSFDGSSFFKELPSSLISIFKALESSGFYFVLVGGGVRDYLLYNKLPNDLDFEIRHIEPLKEIEWNKRLSESLVMIREQFDLQIEKLSYSVFRFKLGDYDIELASPRIEHFLPGSLGHSNFTVELYSDLSFNRAFSRRDFTINAIGAEILCSESTVQLRDPFNGIADLEKKQLRHCGDSFTLDPVRLLRGIRFSLRFGFSFAPETESLFSNFDLTELSRFYFESESFKSQFFPFMSSFYKTVGRNQIPIPKWCQAVSFLGEVNRAACIKTSRELACYLILNGIIEDTRALKSFLPLKDSFYSSLLDLKEQIQLFDYKWIVESCSRNDLESPHFDSFFKLYQLLGRMNDINISLLEGETKVIVEKILMLIRLDLTVAIEDSIPKKLTGRYVLYKRMESAWRS